MDSKIENDEYGTCRCCQSKGNHRNISREYMFEGSREVYIEIFMDCFNLFLTIDQFASQLICTNCIHKLRDANKFRNMVASAERLLNNAESKLDTVFVNVPSDSQSQDVVVKEELEQDIKEEYFDRDTTSPALYEPNNDLMDAEYTLIPGEAELLARCGITEKLPTRETLYKICPEYVKHLDLLNDVKLTSDMIKLRTDKPQSQKTYIPEKMAYITNATTLIQNSNIVPFKSKKRSGFPCFYCRKPFEDLNMLRKHSQDHKPSEIAKILAQEQKLKGIECLIVYVDVTDLRCTICSRNLANMGDLKAHLVRDHKKKMYSVTERVIPFKLKGQSYECQICACNFETFGAVERHMNGHYRNYVCKDCGAGFITKYRLKVHCKSMHVVSSHPCEICGKIFSTQQKYKNHVNSVHKQVQRFKCAKCSLRFSEYFKRQKHMEEIHGVNPLSYKCNVCDRAFSRKYTLSRHLKRDHLEERDYQCEICAYKCFTKNELTVHMVKHNGERIFECSVCKKSYARKKTLREHMRIHNNDRRFACAVCGQAFVQKCSLKGHLKTHHCNWEAKCTER